MKLRMVGLGYENVGILILPKPVYQDENGNLWRYDYSWEKEQKCVDEKKELERILSIHKFLPQEIEGRIAFKNKYCNWIGIRDNRGNIYKFELMEPL